MVKTAVSLAARPEESVIVKVTVVSPNGKTSGALLLIPSVTVPSTLSVEETELSHAATAVSVFEVPLESVAPMVASSIEITGGD